MFLISEQNLTKSVAVFGFIGDKICVSDKEQPVPEQEHEVAKKKYQNTGGPQIVLFLCTQGTVLLTKPYYSGTDLVLK